MADTLNVIQVGTANFGAHRRMTLRQSGLYNLLATFDFNQEAMAAAQREDGAAPTASFEALLDTPGAEALIVSTGGKYHADQVIAGLERGLHVFVEKPLCSTPEEMRAMLAAQRRSGRVVACGHNDHSSDAHSLAIKRAISADAFGTITAFEGTTAHSGSWHIKPGDWRGDPQKNPGGMLFQCGCHKLHELMFYFGPIKRVIAMMRYDVNKTTGTADSAQVLVEFVSGVQGTLSAYHVTPLRHTLFIFGTKQAVYSDNQFFDIGEKTEIQTTGWDGKIEPRLPLPITDESDKLGNVKSFYRAVREGTPVYPSLADGARAVAAVFAAEESVKLGRWVDVEPIDA